MDPHSARNRLFVFAVLLRIVIALSIWFVAAGSLPNKSDLEVLARINHYLETPDSYQYHQNAVALAEYWRTGQVPKEKPGMILEEYAGFPILLAGLYYLTWPHPLVCSMFNIFLLLAAALLIFRLSMRLHASAPLATATALFVFLWPPSVSYLSVPLKDTTNIFSMALLIGGMSGLYASDASSRIKQVFDAFLLFVGLYLLVAIRPQLIALLVMYLSLSSVFIFAYAAKSGNISFVKQAVVVAIVSLGIAAGVCFAFTSLVGPNAPIKIVPSKVDKSSVSHNREGELPPSIMKAGVLGSVSDGYQQMEKNIWQKRNCSIISGGLSLVPNAHVAPTDIKSKAFLVLSSWKYLIFFPVPWESWPYKPNFKLINFCISFWMLCWYLLLPGLAHGLIKSLRYPTPTSIITLFWVIVSGTIISLVDTNMGTLLRHRDLVLFFLLPFFSIRPYSFLFKVIR